MRRSLAFAFLLALSSSSTAWGQDDPTTKAARARFQEGVEFYDKGQFENARAAFLQAYALKHHPAVLLNLAQSCLKSNHPLDGAKYFAQYLKDSTGLTPAQKAEGEKGLAEARAKLGRLDVQAAAGAEISVDGERVGVAPLPEALDVEPGSHAVRVKDANGTSEQRVSVASGQTLPVKFAAATAVTPTTPTPTPSPTPDNNGTTPTPPTPTPDSTGATPPTPPPTPEQPTGPRPKTGLYLAIGGGVVAVGGFVLAGVFAGLKSSANDKYTSVEATIRGAGGGPGTCTTSAPYSATSKFQAPCKTLLDNKSAVDADATAANVGVAIGIVGLAAAAGGVVWYLLSKPQPAESGQVNLVPWIGSEAKGLSLTGSF